MDQRQRKDTPVSYDDQQTRRNSLQNNMLSPQPDDSRPEITHPPSIPRETLNNSIHQESMSVPNDTRQSNSSQIIITFHSTDPEHPNNWSSGKKFFIVFTGIMSVINSTLGSSLPSGAIGAIASYFHVTNQLELVLPISTYLIGYIIGPIMCGPLSENYGRKPVMVYSFILYTCFTLGCALSPNWSCLLVFRWLCGVMASAPVAVVGGLFADIYGEPRKRGIAMAWFMAATVFGPLLAPSISGFIAETTTWRWVFWAGLIFTGATLPLLMFMPETYVPIILHRKAAKMRQDTGNPNIIAKTDLTKKDARYVITVVMTRPFRMIIHESIVFFTCIYLALAYGIFYFYFEAYPIVFRGIYHMSLGISGLAFLPIGVGAVICSVIFVWYDSYLEKARHRQAKWSYIEEYRRLPLACVGGPLYVISLLWLGWSAYSHIHWIVPMLSGITFGMGFLLIFMAMLNYLSDSYETYSASALGIASTCRSIFAALLPLASQQMFEKLGVHWACSLLAFLSLGMAIIPFAFIRYGDHIRANSKFCQELKATKAKDKEEEEEEKEQRKASMTMGEVGKEV